MSRRRKRSWVRRHAGTIAAGVAIVGVGVVISVAGNPLHGGAAIVKGLSVLGLGSLKGGVLVAAGTPVAAKCVTDRAAGNGR